MNVAKTIRTLQRRLAHLRARTAENPDRSYDRAEEGALHDVIELLSPPVVIIRRPLEPGESARIRRGETLYEVKRLT